MKHASLFSGIGGFDLAAQWMGWENVFQVEIDGFCQKVLAKNFPNVTRYRDIKQFDGTKYTGAIDVLSGGFPCQPFSTAGQRKGKEDDRYLWPQMLRIIREVQPRWIVGENVSGLLNLSGGMVLKQIKIDLETEGYSVIPPFILPACSKNAPHRRDRLWIIAYSQSDFKHYGDRREPNPQKVQEERFNESEAIANPNSVRFGGVEESTSGHQRNGRGKAFCESKPYGFKWFTTNPLSLGSFNQEQERKVGWLGHSEHNIRDVWEKFPTQPPVYRGDDGLPNRVDRIKSLGNAIVPQVAFEIFKAIDYLRYK